MFLKPFLNHLCSVAGYNIKLKDATIIREYHIHEDMPLLAALLFRIHPDAMSSPGEQLKCSQPAT